ncbi:hypothetical protein O181_124541 [Austropuccinia psidii MF-1]|uniref:Reverse transcriptase/retrotransposon-derived protein RNase H-like domain-containing protein n=1 Tax=Austropuccinia psidii MF-1 TaxID=1389203 RepID=A0A9Q3Q490_9BASI|nr:hypothetical protein [Austropuccinia psidii MF-1]
MLFNPSLALPISTTVSSRIIQRRSVHSPVFFRKIPVSPSMRKLLVSFTNSPLLSHFNPSLPTNVDTDASHYALGAALSQVFDSGKHPIAFDSPKTIPEELNYVIHDKELLGLVWLSSAGGLFSCLFLPLLKFSPITLPFNTSCPPNYSLAIKPAGLNSISQSLTALDA